MAGMKRFVTYIYAYEDQKKGSNTGFAKIEIRGEECRIEIHLRGVYVGCSECTAYLFREDHGMILGVPIGEITLLKGTGDFAAVIRSGQIQESPFGIYDMEGIFLVCKNETVFMSRWKEGAPLHVDKAHFKVWEAPSIENEIKKLAGFMPQETKPQESKQQGLKPQESKPKESKPVSNMIKPEAFQSKESERQEKEPKCPLAEMGRAVLQFRNPGFQNVMESFLQPGTEPEKKKNEKQEPFGDEAAKEQNEKESPLTEKEVIKESESLWAFEAVKEKSEKWIPAAGESAEKEAAPVRPWETPVHTGELSQEHIPEICAEPLIRTAETDGRPEGINTKEENVSATEIPMRNIFPRYRWSEIWDTFIKSHPVSEPFEEKTVSCVQIDLRDLRELPKRYWYLGNNSFLLHGFFNYHHLIIGKAEEDRWFIGIPGIYQNQERVMAAIFGFPEFIPVAFAGSEKDGKVHDKEAPEAEPINRFGYWYRFMEE